MPRFATAIATLLVSSTVFPVAALGKDAPPSVVVMLVPQLRFQELSPAIRAFRSQVLDLPVEFRVEKVLGFGADRLARTAIARQVAASTGAAVVLWCDLAPPASVSFLIVGRQDDQPLVRSVSASEPEDPLEALALIVRGSVRAALQGRATQPDRAEADVAVPPVPANGKPLDHGEPRRWLDMELGYAYQPFSADNPDTHAIQVGLAINAAEHWRVLARFRILLASVAGASPSARTRLRRFPTSLGAQVFWRYDDFELATELCATLDYVDTETWAPDLGISPDQSDFQFTLMPAVRLSLLLTPRLWVFLALGVELFLNNKTYGVLGKQGRETLLEPWPVRPNLVLGFSAELF